MIRVSRGIVPWFDAPKHCETPTEAARRKAPLIAWFARVKQFQLWLCLVLFLGPSESLPTTYCPTTRRPLAMT